VPAFMPAFLWGRQSCLAILPAAAFQAAPACEDAASYEIRPLSPIPLQIQATTAELYPHLTPKRVTLQIPSPAGIVLPLRVQYRVRKIYISNIFINLIFFMGVFPGARLL